MFHNVPMNVGMEPTKNADAIHTVVGRNITGLKFRRHLDSMRCHDEWDFMCGSFVMNHIGQANSAMHAAVILE